MEEYGEVFYQTVYQDGTHALAALGMVAPLTESVLVRLLQYVPKMATPKQPRHARWLVPDEDPARWNCKYRWDETNKKWCDDIIGGIDQMSKVVDINSILTRDDRRRIRALFNYRNYMFHNGIEWPEDKAKEFDQLVAGWPAGWFTSARSGSTPWIFYMTEAFTDECIAMLERFVDGVGTLVMSWNESTGGSFDDLIPPSNRG